MRVSECVCECVCIAYNVQRIRLYSVTPIYMLNNFTLPFVKVIKKEKKQIDDEEINPHPDSDEMSRATCWLDRWLTGAVTHINVHISYSIFDVPFNPINNQTNSRRFHRNCIHRSIASHPIATFLLFLFFFSFFLQST